MSAISEQGYHNILMHVGAPQTQENMRALHAWQEAEGGNAEHNPFNTTQGANGATNYNDVGVKNYPSEAVGVDATVRTLRNGYYRRILEALKTGNDGYAVCQAIDASVWGTHHAAATFHSMFPGDHGGTTSEPRLLRYVAGQPLMHGDDVRYVQQKLEEHGFMLDVDGWYGKNTAHDVTVFQREHHLSDDGVVGPDTRKALGL